MPNLTKLLRADDVAEILGVSRRTAMELMRQMPNINIGTSMRRPRLAVRREDLDRWIASRTSPPDGPAVKQQRRKPVRSLAPGLLDEFGHIPRRRTTV